MTPRVCTLKRAGKSRKICIVVTTALIADRAGSLHIFRASAGRALTRVYICIHLHHNLFLPTSNAHKRAPTHENHLKPHTPQLLSPPPLCHLTTHRHILAINSIGKLSCFLIKVAASTRELVLPGLSCRVNERKAEEKDTVKDEGKR